MGKKLKIELENPAAICRICGKLLTPNDGTSVGSVSIDHIEPVAVHFNRVGYQWSHAQRADWYNDIENLCLVHASCNSRKGSGNVRFDIEKVRIAARNFH